MIQLSAILDNIRTLKDGGLKITIDTQDIKAESIAELFDMRNKYVRAAFSETGIKAEDITLETVEFKGDKTSSQRLRGVLYVYWEKNNDNELILGDDKQLKRKLIINIVENDNLERMNRYETSIERKFYRAINEYRALKNGFVS